jgi:hypothetical protein
MRPLFISIIIFSKVNSTDIHNKIPIFLKYGSLFLYTKTKFLFN